MTARPIIFSGPMVSAILSGRKRQTRRIAKRDHGKPLDVCPYGKRGDLLWVRESFRIDEFDYAETIYRADFPREDAKAVSWRPSIHMPRSRSRLTLILDDWAVEPLHAITNCEARLEGFPSMLGAPARDAFRHYWEQINPGTWATNPWVWVLTFSPETRNVDAPS